MHMLICAINKFRHIYQLNHIVMETRHHRHKAGLLS